MVRIRLRRTGAKNNPAYRIVVADQKSPRDGAFIETLGHYLPTRQPHVVEIDGAKARKWLAQGAQPSDTALSLLKQKGIVDANGKVTPEGTEAPVYGAPTPVAPTPVAPTPVAATPAPVAETPAAEPIAEPIAEVPAEPVAQTPAASVGEPEVASETTPEGASA